MRKKNIVLSSTEPIMDGGRKYNFLYIIGLIIGFVVGVILEGINMGILFALIGALVACAAKNFMCEVDCTNLRHMSFACTRKIPYAQLIQGLQPLLLPLNMVIERKKDGSPTILYKGLIYDVSYNEDDTFGIWWRRPVNIKTFLITKIYVSIIRRASVAYGIIAYNVQKICNDSSSENTDVIEQEEIVFQKQDIITCPSCGNECKIGTKFCMKCGSNLEMRDDGKRVASENSHIKKSGKLKYIILSVLVILIGLVCITVFMSKDGNNVEYISIVRDGYLGEFTDATVQDILNSQLGAFDYNLEWTNANHDGSEYVGMRAYTEDDSLGEINILFEVFPDNGTFKVIDYADDSGTDYQATEIADQLNNYYMSWYIFNQFESGASRNEETAIMQELITRFDKISGTAVLYGASKDYAGDRGKLGKLIDNQEPLNLSVTELINQYSDGILDAYIDASKDNIIEEEQDVGIYPATDIDYTWAYDYAFSSVDTYTEYGSYYLWDLDGNGVYELILGHGEFSSDFVNDIWTIGDDGGILGLGSIGGECEFYVAPDYNGIYAVHGHMGHEEITRITLVDSKLLTEIVSERELGEDEDYYSSEMVIASADINDRSLLERISSMSTDIDIQLEQPLEYIFPESDSAYLTEADLDGLTQSDCQIARNEIYARHGRLFKDKTLQAYFDSCSWYIGTIPGDEFDDSVLNEYEIANRDLIAEYEKSQGF